ncbi:hypothetical protein GCM10010329_36510 [Streptomyces spiroverticillatus]|uniref:Gram-positive cocci surface proteins LPxTG domain-containing protein n=1 Tax=Streptomyces finlayi TaxID=67296 RepID=A0A918WYH2_9ACTN|nr:hypothetical protein [Streptomyces finlayi]GHA10471.1 hypothetical protein GCM10010329_36510 [Streptomyces spiroverticillatus]GHC95601.1 hypothetical protein GCM10010334_35100 [Streptomyces finlayi]
MRLRSALVLGVTAATLAPASGAVASTADDGLLDHRLCSVAAVGTLLGASDDCTDSTDSGDSGASAESPHPGAVRTQAQPAPVQEEVPGRPALEDPPLHTEEARPFEIQLHREPLRPQEAAPPRRISTRPAALTPTCGDPDSADFPLTTRIHRAPASYRPGGDSAEWALDLANTTDTACPGVHPVLVLTDEARTLRPGDVRAEYHAGGAWHRIPFVRTDRDELIGVFGEDLPGFAVGGGQTQTVRVRLGFAESAAPGAVVANAAIVQRRGDDGDWVGQSDDYRFMISNSVDQESSYTAGAGSPHQLAQSGPSPLLGLGDTAVAFLLGGGALVVGSRRMRTPPKR